MENTNKKFKIGVDYDNILSDTTSSWVRLFNAYTGSDITLDDIKQWDMTMAVEPRFRALMQDLALSPRLWNSITPVKDSQKYMELLCRDFDVYIITNTDWEVCDVKMKWLFENFPLIDRRNLFICGVKQLINVDILIDDKPANLAGGTYSKLLYDYPWNRSVVDKKEGFIRCADWSEIYSVVQEITGTK